MRCSVCFVYITNLTILLYSIDKQKTMMYNIRYMMDFEIRMMYPISFMMYLKTPF